MSESGLRARTRRTSSRPTRYGGSACALLVLLLLTTAPKAARVDVAQLSALKAAYTFHFLNLIQWERLDSSFAFCVFGESEAGDRMLSMLEDKHVRGRNVRTRRVALGSLQRQRCDAVYIPETHAAQAPALLKYYENAATVTISDIPRFAKDGGIIEFVVVDDRLRFDVNERAAAQRRLKISAKLLELARQVIR